MFCVWDVNMDNQEIGEVERLQACDHLLSDRTAAAVGAIPASSVPDCDLGPREDQRNGNQGEPTQPPPPGVEGGRSSQPELAPGLAKEHESDESKNIECQRSSESDTQPLPDTTALLPDTTALLPDTTALLPDTTALLPDTTALLPDTTALLPDTTALLPDTTALLPDTTALLPDTTAPPPETDNPAPPLNPTPLPDTPAPTPDTTAPPPNPASLRDTTAPPPNPAPLPDTPAPTTDTTARTPDTTARTPDTTAPTPDTTARTPDTTAPTPDTTAPTPDITAPTPDITVPVPDTAPPQAEVVTDNGKDDSGEFVVTIMARGKLEEQGVGVKGRSSPLSETGTPAEASSFMSHREEDVTAESWRQHRKHVFVLSEAGKPIYSRYGSEEALSSTMGVMMALVSFVQSGDNIIRSMYSDEHAVVFLQKGPLVLVSVSSSRQSEQQLRAELLYVYYQIISMLTQASIARIFEHKKNYDLRRLLAGSEKILDGLLNLVDSDPSFLLTAVHCLPLASSLRDSLSQILQKAITPNLVFSILIAKNQLLTIVQEKTVIEDTRLEPADVHLLLNLIGASSAFQAGEIWTPICLPLFNPDCYFYAYISYLDPPECTVCLLLLSTDKEAFYAVAECKRRIEEAMAAQNALSLIAKVQLYSVSQVGVSDLRHFMYKPFDVPDNHRQLTQFTSPEMEAPYASEVERMRLLDLYRYMHSRIHSSSRPLKLIYHVAEKETLLAWVTSKFELYTCFSPLVTKACAINAITKLLRWIKKEEDRLFIRYPPKYSTTPNPSKSSRGGKSDQQDSTDNGFLSLL